jgi:phosphoglycolate phosphatase-like HAD superfamily hydrolase
MPEAGSGAPGASRPRLVVGFDLDMTLIDTVAGFAATLEALGVELGIAFPTEEMTSRLGPPLEHMLAEHMGPQEIEAAGDRFRALYPDHAIAPTPAFPGAHEAISAVRAAGGRVILVTGKYTANAQLHVDHLGFDIDHLEGWVWGVGKADVLTREGATIYVGDHIHDVEGARAAGIISVSVLTGGCTRQELEDAGTDVVLDDLTTFPAWLEGHLAATAPGQTGSHEPTPSN